MRFARPFGIKNGDDHSAGGPGIRFALDRLDEFGERPRAEVAFAAVADRDGAGFGFLGADHEHIRDLLQLRVADFSG